MVNDFNQSIFNFIQEPIQHVKHHPCNSLYTTEQKRTKLYSSRLNMSGHMQETYNIYALHAVMAPILMGSPAWCILKP